MTMSNLLFTKVVVSIHVSVYRYQQTSTLLHTYNTHCHTLQATYLVYKQVPNGAFSHAWSQMFGGWKGVSLFTGLDYWTGLLNWTTGLTFNTKTIARTAIEFGV